METRLCLNAASFAAHDLGTVEGIAKSVADIDGDGDVDILFRDDNTVAWYENTDGRGAFAYHEIDWVDALVALAADDIDGDARLDLLSDRAWYENYMPGNANDDHSFDQRDLAQVFVSGKYRTDLAAGYTEGDGNGDGLFDHLDIMTALATAKYQSNSQSAITPGGSLTDGRPSIVYDSATGEMALNTPTGQELTSINIVSENN